MANCKKCEQAAPIGQALCDDCINNWLIVRQVIQARLTEQYGEATRENLPSQQQEIQRLENTWKRDREQFKKEVNTWYT